MPIWPTSYLWIPAETGWSCGMTGFIRGDHEPWLNSTHSNSSFQLVVAKKELPFDREGQRLTLPPGGFLLLRPNQMHQHWGPVNPETGFYFARFHTSATPIWRNTLPLLNLDGPSVHVAHVALPDVGVLPSPEPILSLFEQLVTMQESVHAVDQVLANGLLTQLIAQIAQQCASISPRKPDGPTDPYDPGLSARQTEIVFEVIEYIERHLNHPIRARDVCQELNLSYKYVARIVKTGLGMTLTDYLNRRRIHKARTLLLRGNCSVGEVSQAVGFADPYYFSRVFRQIEGVSPSEFRKSGYGPRQ